jgi:hypothetical protein
MANLVGHSQEIALEMDLKKTGKSVSPSKYARVNDLTIIVSQKVKAGIVIGEHLVRSRWRPGVRSGGGIARRLPIFWGIDYFSIRLLQSVRKFNLNSPIVFQGSLLVTGGDDTDQGSAF